MHFVFSNSNVTSSETRSWSY